MPLLKKLNPEEKRIPIKYPGGCLATFLTGIILFFVGPAMLKIFWASISSDMQKFILITIAVIIVVSLISFGIWATRKINQ